MSEPQHLQVYDLQRERLMHRLRIAMRDVEILRTLDTDYAITGNEDQWADIRGAISLAEMAVRMTG